MSKTLLTLTAFTETYARRHPEQLPSRPQGQRRNWLILILLAIALLAVNILSGAHTIPVIKTFYPDVIDPAILSLIGTAGFIAIEGFMVMLMAQEKRSFQSWVVIVLAFLAALGSNLYSTLYVQSPNMFVGLLLGIFAPAANLAGGEVLREERLRVKREQEAEEREFQERMGEFQRNAEKAYRSYLTKSGITGEEEKALLISGREIEVREGDFRIEERVERVETKNSPAPKGARELAIRMARDGTGEESYSQLKERYSDMKPNNNTISAARKLLRAQQSPSQDVQQ